ncbi:acylase [Sphingomonas gilva]|uniref:Acylase n=1 Tax=Sphingomonas gilva TaxID=2305907 RepID=A0A396RQL7_9SPHN|nr:acylase [Sphingomonas gilva]RHW18800.1 acylase [Sphingomonas gilva]
MRRLKRVGLGFVALLIAAAVALAVWEPLASEAAAPPPARAYDVEIVRDEFGVPHIFGRTDADVAYGVAWAHAEDDFSTIQEVLAMTRARLGAMTGADGAKIDYVAHLLDIRGTVARRYAGLPADVRALLDGYAAGMNLYAERHPGEVRLAKLFPVNGEDVAAGFALRSPFFFGLDETLGALAAGDDLPRPVRVPTPVGGDPAANGSNAFAVAPTRSGDGATRLVSNSHQPWRGGVAWYELVVHSGEGWDFAGATFPGSPYPFLGHNRTLGWTNTVNRPDLIDVYRLAMTADGEAYRFDGRTWPLKAKRVWLRAKFGPFVIPVPRMVYRSIHGPVIRNDEGAFAIRYAGIDRLDMLTQYYRLNKARDFGEWRAAMAAQGVPATNFVYADKDGNIALFYNAMFPDRARGFDWRGVLPGDTSAALWTRTLPFSAVPANVNPASGYVMNANNTPYVAAGPGDEIAPSSPLLGVETDMTNRAIRAIELLERPGPIGAERLEAIKFDTGYSRESYATPWMRALLTLDPEGDADIAAAQKLLASWDWTADGRGRADAIAVLALRPANRQHYRRLPPPDPREELKAVTSYLRRVFGRLDPPLGKVLRIRQGEADYPMDGGNDTLRAATLWDELDDGRMGVRHGDSFILFAEWDAGGRVRSKSIQPFGQATTRPDSPHYADQAALFSAHRFKPVHFDPAELRRFARRRYRPGEAAR